MNDEWGPWIEHDGKGCPVRVGEYVKVVGVFGSSGQIAEIGEEITDEGWLTDGYQSCAAWDWSNFNKVIEGERCGKIIRYRIRKPKGMQVLDQIMADLHRPVEVVK